MMSNDTTSKISKCGLSKLITFLLALFFGTGFSICSKMIMDMPVGRNDNSEDDGGGDGGTDDESTATSFQKPLFLTFGMFVATFLALPLHLLVLVFRIPFPGYDFEVTIEVNGVSKEDKSEGREQAAALLDGSLSNDLGATQNDHDGIITTVAKRKNIPVWMYFYMAIPAILDFAATLFCMVGLQHVEASTFQLLRGSGLIFVALLKQFVLKEHLYKFHWVGLFWIVASVAIVSSAAFLLSASSPTLPSVSIDNISSQTLLGVCQVLIGTFLMACQFVSEEHVMRMAVPAPPLLLIGMQGFWGVLLCIIIMFPVGYYIPGEDNGSYEDPFSTWDELVHSNNVRAAFSLYLGITFFYYLFAVLVTFMLCSVWHAMLDNFRPITVWATQVMIYYFVNPLYGEMWTEYSYLQIVGMTGLLYGTAIYNAPNTGSLHLEGQWWALGLDFSKEYDTIRQQHEVETEEEDCKYHRIT